jgi:hypothetical protein
MSARPTWIEYLDTDTPRAFAMRVEEEEERRSIKELLKELGENGGQIRYLEEQVRQLTIENDRHLRMIKWFRRFFHRLRRNRVALKRVGQASA